MSNMKAEDAAAVDIESLEVHEHVRTARGANAERTQVLQATKHELRFTVTPMGVLVAKRLFDGRGADRKAVGEDALGLVPWPNVRFVAYRARPSQ
jgi:hypothetical protein